MATQFATVDASAACGQATALGPADWLSLAAAPTFAIMALLVVLLGDGPADMLCSSAACTAVVGTGVTMPERTMRVPVTVISSSTCA